VTARSATAATLLAVGALLLAGCAAEPSPSPSPSASARPSVTAAPSPMPSATATAAPEPSPEPEPVTCETLLTPEAIDALARDGLELRANETSGYPLAEQLAAAGATACTWARPQSDIHLTVVQLEVAAGEEEAWNRVLSENGYTATDDPVPGIHTGPEDPGTGISPVVLVEPGRITFASTPTIVTDLAPAA
jgi:hypothetical protein